MRLIPNHWARLNPKHSGKPKGYSTETMTAKAIHCCLVSYSETQRGMPKGTQIHSLKGWLMPIHSGWHWDSLKYSLKGLLRETRLDCYSETVIRSHWDLMRVRRFHSRSGLMMGWHSDSLMGWRLVTAMENCSGSVMPRAKNSGKRTDYSMVMGSQKRSDSLRAKLMGYYLDSRSGKRWGWKTGLERLKAKRFRWRSERQTVRRFRKPTARRMGLLTTTSSARATTKGKLKRCCWGMRWAMPKGWQRGWR